MFDRTADLYDLFYDFKDYSAEADAIRTSSHCVDRARGPCSTSPAGRGATSSICASRTPSKASTLTTASWRLPPLDCRGCRCTMGDMRDLDLGREVRCRYLPLQQHRLHADSRGSATGPWPPWHGILEPRGLLIVRTLARSRELRPEPCRGHAGGRGRRSARGANQQLTGGGWAIDYGFPLLGVAGGVGKSTSSRHTRLASSPTTSTRAAFERAGLDVEHDPTGLTGRGLWIGTRADWRESASDSIDEWISHGRCSLCAVPAIYRGGGSVNGAAAGG